MGEVFLGTEALATGKLTGYALRRWYQPIFRDVYIPKRQTVTIRDRAIGAWMWSKRKAVIAGAAASALHGAEWVDDDAVVELRLNCTRPPPGIVARNETLTDDEICWTAGVPVTTPARTAFDLGRHLPRGRALERLDALMRATGFSAEDVGLIAKRNPGARGICQLRELLTLVDSGAASPRETRLRLLLIDAGFPRPATQIPAVDSRGWLVRTLDMGWENLMIAAEYDGDQHRKDRTQYVKDMRVLRKLGRMGWIVIRVIKEDRDDEVVRRVHTALTSRGWKP
jgi:hypothetical protein